MDEKAVREHAQAAADALLAGDIGSVVDALSKELRSNVGPIVAMLPMPMSEASIERVDTTGTGYMAVLRLVGEGITVRLETRWKERDGRPTIVEVSRVHEEPVAPPEAEAGEQPTDTAGG